MPLASTGSRNNLEEELEDYVPNGSAKLNDDELRRNQEIYGAGDSLTKPLRPDPRYNNGPIEMSSTTLTGRPSTKHRKRATSGAPLSGDRPSTRPASRVTQLLDDLNDDDF